MKQELIAKLRLLRRVLLLSGFLNIVLAIALLFSHASVPSFNEWEIPFISFFSSKKVPLGSLIPRMEKASFEELVPLLADRTNVDKGYKVRDYALSYLVSNYTIDLQRALKMKTLPSKRYLAIVKNGEKKFIELFPYLNHVQFASIQQFCKEERWPITAELMFAKLSSQEPSPPSLSYAFLLTKEFASMETIAKKKCTALEKEAFLALLLEGPYSLIDKWSQLASCETVSDDLFRELLFDYIEAGSEKAVRLYLQTDLEYALTSLPDKRAALLLRLKEKDSAKAKYAAALLASSQDQEIAIKAQQYLSYHFEQAAAYAASEEKKTLPQEPTPKLKETPPLSQKKKASPPSLYTVKKGDTLWGISKKFSVSVHKIKKENGLSSDALSPGMKLTIPKPGK